MNLLSSSMYKHLKINLIKHKQSLILGKCGSQLISVFSNTKMYKYKFKAKTMLILRNKDKFRLITNGNVASLTEYIKKFQVSFWHFNKSENGI